jgi:hypothetical protein
VRDFRAMERVQAFADPILATLDGYQLHLTAIIEDVETTPEMRVKALALLAQISVALTQEARASRGVYLN